MEKEPRILMIVESPNKVKTIKQFLPKNYIVMASVGHICKIADSGLYNMGIDPNDNFKANYKISDDKKDIVNDLKDQVKFADKVIIATDPDREGEAIAYHLKNFLKIPESKYERVTYHEITQKAILEALNNATKINTNKAISAITRARLDKIVGYRLSPISRKMIQALSVGRCQSAGLKILVDRELEIKNFNPEKYFELWLKFKKSNTEFKAKYIGTEKEEKTKFKTYDEILPKITYFNSNKDNYVITRINTKNRLVYPKPAFTTSSFQQEVSNKLGITVKKAMEYAQKLFEGIDVGNQHLALITYIRTDSTEFAPEFVTELTSHIKQHFGNEYYAPIRKVKQKETIQDGHEAIRPVDLEITPEWLSTNFNLDPKLVQVYSIIYNRTLATSMSPATIADTEYIIQNGEHYFTFSSHEMLFDGFKLAYSYEEENDDEYISIINFEINERLRETVTEIASKETKPPRRYSEASFINTLDKLSIGRPSTYASIVSTLLDTKRGYCKLDNKVMVPTDLGINLASFLDKSFSDIINLNYTAELERDLDLISNGELNDVKFLSDFYSRLENNIKNVMPVQNNITDEICPQCGKNLIKRSGKYGDFLGCSGFPKCKYIKKI